MSFLFEVQSLESFNEKLKPLGLQFSLSEEPVEGSTPMVVSGKTLGHLTVSSENCILEESASKPLIELASEQIQAEAALRYEMQNTLEELISKYEELTVLYESAETVATVMNLEDVSRLILEQAAEILEVSQGSLMLLNDEGDLLEVVAARGA